MDGYERTVQMAADIIEEHDKAKATIAESSDYLEIEKARDFLAGFQDVLATMRNQFVGVITQLEQLEAKCGEIGLPDTRAKIQHCDAIMQKFIKLSRE